MRGSGMSDVCVCVCGLGGYCHAGFLGCSCSAASRGTPDVAMHAIGQRGWVACSVWDSTILACLLMLLRLFCAPPHPAALSLPPAQFLPGLYPICTSIVPQQRFSSDERVYKAFLEILNMYRKGQKTISDVYSEVGGGRRASATCTLQHAEQQTEAPAACVPHLFYTMHTQAKLLLAANMPLTAPSPLFLPCA